MLWGPKVIKSAPKGSPEPRFRPRKERPMAKEKSEEPPPRIESAHQVLLRLHLLDAALLYSKGS